MPVDFWAHFQQPSSANSPVMQLKEQAALLGDKTGGLVRASVQSNSDGDGGFTTALLLWSPYIEGYRYRLLELAYPVGYYPLKIRAGDELHEARNQGEFTGLLMKVLSSERTAKIVEAIMAQATAVQGSEA
jgi:hypothetical protein